MLVFAPSIHGPLRRARGTLLLGFTALSLLVAILPPPVLPAASNLQLYAAVLPASRSVQVGSAATAFSTLINAGSSTASSCGIAPNSPLPLSLVYQTTDPATNALTSIPNTPVDVPAGGSQSFVVGLTPTGTLPPVYTNFAFFCANANVAPQSDGIDALLLSGSTTPTPDIVALAASGDPGIVDIPGTNGSGAFAVATVNVGAAGTITATADTGGVTLPISITSVRPPRPPALAWERRRRALLRRSTPTTRRLSASSSAVLTPCRSTLRTTASLCASWIPGARGATSVAVRTQ
jgi:hypothetical protein